MVNKRKLRELEDMVLPDLPEPPRIYKDNEQEIALSKKADKIRDRLEVEAEKLFNGNLTLKERTAYGREVLDSLTPEDKLVLTTDYNFNRIRLRDLIYEFFKIRFPTVAHSDLNNRIMWFLTEMDNLAFQEIIIDSEWTHNRNEDDSDFDDFAWWDHVEGLLKEEFPDGVFTEATYKKMEEWMDAKMSEFIGQYYREHPEEHKRLMESLDKQLQEVKASG